MYSSMDNINKHANKICRDAVGEIYPAMHVAFVLLACVKILSHEQDAISC